jgi:glycosidase
VFEHPGNLTNGPYQNPYELVTFYDNHDMARLAASDDGFIDANNWLFTARGIPVIYYGSETGFERGKAEGWRMGRRMPRQAARPHAAQKRPKTSARLGQHPVGQHGLGITLLRLTPERPATEHRRLCPDRGRQASVALRRFRCPSCEKPAPAMQDHSPGLPKRRSEAPSVP